jgi:hypothetical protein
VLTDLDDEQPAVAPALTDQERIGSAYNAGEMSTSDTCRGCRFSGQRAGQPWCKERRFVIRLEDPACPRFEAGKR